MNQEILLLDSLWPSDSKRSRENKIYKISQWINMSLTHWGRVTHICVSKLTITGSDNGLSPGWCQVIIWINAGILLIRSLGTLQWNLKWNSCIFIQENACEYVICEMAAILSQPQCVNSLRHGQNVCHFEDNSKCVSNYLESFWHS